MLYVLFEPDTIKAMKKLSIKKLSLKRKKSNKTAHQTNHNFKQRLSQKLLSWDLRKLTQTMLLFAFVFAIAGSYLWYTRMYLTDERRFWNAINISMSTPSVTRTLKNGGTGNEVVQRQQFFYSPLTVSRSVVQFTQKSATVDTYVATEGVSYLDRQYSRYTNFRTNQKRDDGKVPSLDPVLGKWSSIPVTNDEVSSSKDAYVGELITLAVFGNLDANFRHELIGKMKTDNVYKIYQDDVLEQELEGEQIVLIPTTVKLKYFAKALNSAFERSGLGTFSPLNEDNFTESSEIRATFYISKKDGTIRSIEYGNRQEKYTGYGVNTGVDEPVASYTSEELEGFVRKEIESAL